MPKKLVFDASRETNAIIEALTALGFVNPLIADNSADVLGTASATIAEAIQAAYDAGRDDISTRDMLDMREAAEVELLSDHSGKVWLNVDGRCMFRAGKADHVKIDLTRDYADEREIGRLTDELSAIPSEPINGAPAAISTETE